MRQQLALLSLATIAVWTSVEAKHSVNISAEPILEVPIARTTPENKDWEDFLRENLHEDLRPWRARPRLRAKDVLETYDKLIKEMYIPAVLQVVLIYRNKLYWPLRKDIHGTDYPNPSSYYKQHFHRRVNAALERGLHLPNALFIYNTDDNVPRFNSPARNLPVPLLSLAKTLGRSPEDNDLDILVPQLFTVPNTLFTFPWHLKKDRAFFRGIAFCSAAWVKRYGFNDACARTYLAYMSARDDAAGNGTELDVGVVERYGPRVDDKGNVMPGQSITADLPVLPREPIAHHAYHKWLLHLEGLTASYRLSQLFFTNSVVLLQRSPFIEYFYRSLRPWEHYVPFWNDSDPSVGMDDIYKVLADVRAREAEDPYWPNRMVTRSQAFAIKFATPHARMLYYQAALLEYRSLFEDMDPFIESFVEVLRSRGWRIEA